MSLQPCTVPRPLVWAATWGQEGQEGARLRVRVGPTARVIESNDIGDGVLKNFDAAQSYNSKIKYPDVEKIHHLLHTPSFPMA